MRYFSEFTKTQQIDAVILALKDIFHRWMQSGKRALPSAMFSVLPGRPCIMHPTKDGDMVLECGGKTVHEVVPHAWHYFLESRPTVRRRASSIASEIVRLCNSVPPLKSQ